MRFRRFASAAVSVLLSAGIAASLTACTISIVDPSAGTPPPSERTEEAPAPTDDDGAAPARGFSAEAQTRRDTLAAKASTTMPCPDGPLTADGTVIRVEGSCAELVIEIDAGAVIADDVESLTLNGSGTVVYVDSVSRLTVTGSASSVFWAGDTPSVSDTGSANELRKG